MEERPLEISNRALLSIAEILMQEGRSFSFRVKGLSMSPFISNGDIVTIQPLKGTVRTGDVLLVKNSFGLPVIHRVIKKTGSEVVTKGDASVEPDEPVAYDKIVGKVVKIQGKGYNFHLKFPFKYLIARGVFNSPVIRNTLFIPLLKRIASLLG
ncbi:MAG: signal peptidase I [Nitrospirae bacterium]|nr:signal peptidase I [Nitrospirota bacterium]